MIKLGHSSSVQHELSSAAPLTAEHSSSAATYPSPPTPGPAAFTLKTSTECMRSCSKHTENQLSILHCVKTEIVHCSTSLCLPIWHLLLDQAWLTVTISQQHINHISSDDEAINQLKEEVTILLGSLKLCWCDLSSMLPDDGPMVYLTGKSDLSSSQFHILSLTTYIRSSSYLFHHWHYGHCCTTSHLSQDICYCHHIRNNGDFIMGLLNIFLFYAFSSDGNNVSDLHHWGKCQETFIWYCPNSIFSQRWPFMPFSPTVTALMPLYSIQGTPPLNTHLIVHILQMLSQLCVEPNSCLIARTIQPPSISNPLFTIASMTI